MKKFHKGFWFANISHILNKKRSYNKEEKIIKVLQILSRFSPKSTLIRFSMTDFGNSHLLVQNMIILESFIHRLKSLNDNDAIEVLVLMKLILQGYINPL